MKTKFLFFLFTVFYLLFFVSSVYALDFTPPPFNDLAYQGQYYNQSLADPITIPAGDSKEITVRFKNVGTKIWEATGSNYVSVYTVNPNYRKSVFAGSDWISSSQVAKISKITKTGEVAEVKINLHAPEKLGDYTENFYFAVENKTWIKSTYFYLKIKVVAGEIISPVSDDNIATPNDDGKNVNVKAQIAGYTNKTITAQTGGEEIKFKIKYKNTGSQNWDSYELYGDLDDSTKSITNDSWESEKKILTKEAKVLSGNDTGWVSFVLQAPSQAGNYKINFNLGIDDIKISGSDTEINLKVLKDATVSYQPSVSVVPPRDLIPEPNIRVRLTSPTGPVKFKSIFEYKIYEGDVFRGDLPANTYVSLEYYGAENGIYSFKSNGLNFSAKEKIRFVPYDMSNYFAIPTLARTVSWKGSERFDTYRGIMEYVYSVKKDEMYIVNELPMSMYVAGIGEMSDSAPFEYMKAIMVAARSYAYYQLNNGTPASERTFDVYASTIDQLYLGYDHEKVSPNAVKAQQETKGEMVTYQGTPVVTPYFGHSDGKTRTWAQVWGGQNKAWIASVATPYDKGKTMFGHGVGISMDDAAQRARQDGWDYKQILKYYYSGVEIEKVY